MNHVLCDFVQQIVKRTFLSVDAVAEPPPPFRPCGIDSWLDVEVSFVGYMLH